MSFCPFQIWPLKTCNKDISKLITASRLKLGQLIEYLVKFLKKNIYFFRDCPLQIWTLKNCNQAITKIIIARSFKLGHLIQDGEWYS